MMTDHFYSEGGSGIMIVFVFFKYTMLYFMHITTGHFIRNNYILGTYKTGQRLDNIYNTHTHIHLCI